MPVQTSFYTRNELSKLGLKRYGKNVRISRKISIYGAENISVADNVRIDDFCILSGNITIGSYVHIASYCGLFGAHGITMEDFSGLSSHVLIYTVSDNYLGGGLTNPTVPDKFKKVDCGPVVLSRHVIVGAGTIVLPKTKMEIGSAVGALSLVKGILKPWSIYSGTPAIFRGHRKSSIIMEYEKNLMRR